MRLRSLLLGLMYEPLCRWLCLLDVVDGIWLTWQTVFPNTTYVVGDDETHVAPVYSAGLIGQESQQGRDLKGWIAAKL